MSRVVAGIQARMGSTRLPGKSLADVAGEPLLRRVVDRIRAAASVDEAVVLTSTESADDPLAEWCRSGGVRVLRGPLQDVYARYAQLLEEERPDYVVRVTGDCPLLDPAHVDAQVEALVAAEGDLAPVPGAEHLYAGQGVLSARALRSVEQSADPRDREHVGSFWFAAHPARFLSVPLEPDPELVRRGRGLRLCVDRPEDLELVRRVFEHFAPTHGSLVPLATVVAWLERSPEVRRLNASVEESEDNRALRRMQERCA